MCSKWEGRCKQVQKWSIQVDELWWTIPGAGKFGDWYLDILRDTWGEDSGNHNALPWPPCHYCYCPHMGVFLTASKITNSSLMLWDSFPRQLWMKTVSQAANLEKTITGLRQQKGKINTWSTHFCEKWLWPFKQLQMNQPKNTRALQRARDCNHSLLWQSRWGAEDSKITEEKAHKKFCLAIKSLL